MKKHPIPTYGKSAKKFVALMESHGYVFDRVNSKGIAFYTHPSLPEQKVMAGMSDTLAHRACNAVLRLVGEATDRDRSKRHPDQVRERQARERDQAAAEAARIERERDALILERDQLVARFGASSVAEANAIARQIQKAENELRYWQTLMTDTPGVVKRAQHRA